MLLSKLLDFQRREVEVIGRRFCTPFFSVAIFAVLFFAASAQALIHLELRPERSTYLVGEVVNVGVYAVSDDESQQSIASLSVVYNWESHSLGCIRRIISGPYVWLASGFYNDSGLDGLNISLCDDDAMQQLLGRLRPDPPAFATPQGLLITTIQFDALIPDLSAEITMARDYGQFSHTRVFDGHIPGFDVTGDLVGTKIRILAQNDFVSSTPSDGTIDARRPTNQDCSEEFGLQSVDLLFEAATASSVEITDFHVSVSPPFAEPPIVINMTREGTLATLEFDRSIPAGHWTRITYLPTGKTTRVGSLPGDVNGDGESGILDVLALVNSLNGVGPVLAAWQTDLDRSGETNALDVLQEIDLLNGADCLDPWIGRTLPE